MGIRPNTELVAAAWLRTVPGVNAGAVATTLPSGTAWAATGFVVVTVVGGTPSAYLPVRRPVVGVDCWAVAPSSSKAPWGQANALAEAVIAATLDPATIGRELTLPAGYDPARVIGAVALGEPVRVTDDQGHYARYRFDLDLDWVPL